MQYQIVGDLKQEKMNAIGSDESQRSQTLRRFGYEHEPVETMEALQRAQQIAVEYQHMQVDEEHMLLSLTREDAKALIPQLLTRCGIGVDAFRAALDGALSPDSARVWPRPQDKGLYFSGLRKPCWGSGKPRQADEERKYLSGDHIFSTRHRVEAEHTRLEGNHNPHELRKKEVYKEGAFCRPRRNRQPPKQREETYDARAEGVRG